MLPLMSEQEYRYRFPSEQAISFLQIENQLMCSRYSRMTWDNIIDLLLTINKPAANDPQACSMDNTNMTASRASGVEQMEYQVTDVRPPISAAGSEMVNQRQMLADKSETCSNPISGPLSGFSSYKNTTLVARNREESQDQQDLTSNHNSSVMKFSKYEKYTKHLENMNRTHKEARTLIHTRNNSLMNSRRNSISGQRTIQNTPRDTRDEQGLNGPQINFAQLNESDAQKLFRSGDHARQML